MNLLIKNGFIVDGTGSPGYEADILIQDDKIKKIGTNLKENGFKVIDASNKVVAPGFIDMHNHGDFTILEVNKAEPTIRQGITTLVIGMCGLGMAPANEKVRKYYSNYVTKIFTLGMQLFDTLQDYMAEIEKKGVSSNLVFFVPQGNVRACVLGMEDRPATQKEMEKMKEIIRKDMDAGAFGLSTGLIYPPGSITQTEEIIELCKIVNEYDGIYDSHMRNEGTGILEEGIGEVIKIAKVSNIRAHISHLKAGSSFAWKKTPEIINLIRSAQKEGIYIHADLYPYEESSTSLSGALLKPWVYEEFEGNLTNPETRKRIIDETFELIFSTFLPDMPFVIRLIPKLIIKKIIISVVKKYMRIISVLNNHHIEGKFLGEAIKILYPKKKFVEALLDFIRDEKGSIMITFKQMSEQKSILQLFEQEFVCVGSDGFLVVDFNTHPRSYGTFPRILSRYVREKNIVSLEEAIRKMTSLPASILDLNDRGIVKPNYKADIVIFDPETIQDKATYENGRQYPIGIDYVIVNGEITVEKGKHLGTLRGEILKHKK